LLVNRPPSTFSNNAQLILVDSQRFVNRSHPRHKRKGRLTHSIHPNSMVSRMHSTPRNSKGRPRLNIKQLVSRSDRKQHKHHHNSSRALPNMASNTTRTDKVRDMVNTPSTEDPDSMVDLRKDMANIRSNRRSPKKQLSS
jgi:hypothetical protein